MNKKNKCPYFEQRNRGCTHRRIHNSICPLNNYKKCKAYKEWEIKQKSILEPLNGSYDILELEDED